MSFRPPDLAHARRADTAEVLCQDTSFCNAVGRVKDQLSSFLRLVWPVSERY